MAPTPKNQRTPTPFSKLNLTQVPISRTPQAKHRLNFTTAKPSPNPNSVAPVAAAAAEHPIEVIGRIRDYPDRKEKPLSSLQVNPDRETLRVKTDSGYRDFSFDGVSLSEEEDIDEFYKKFVQSRINGVKLGDKCTVMMYGPTGAGKSYNMFGSSKQPGIVYRSLRDILGDGIEENDEKISVGTFVQVTVLEIYNEELYDLLSTNNGGGFGFGWSKGIASKVRLEVIGKKAKNATFISGTEATKISKEIQKVEKRRTVKSTLCNERSSRSHCMMIIDVPTVGGRLMLVDMAGSENIEQAGQTGMEAKMQTAKINQGNSALKRVVESIANGDSHVPFRDSKLTMLLQDSFEDDKSKILMILCASPDPKELHKTISTLEYGAKAKCIVRGPHTPLKEKGAEDSSSAVILGSRIAAMDKFIYKLQRENKLKEIECNEAKRKLMKKEEEIATLRSKLELVQGGVETTEEDIIVKVNERTQMLKHEFESKIQICQKKANEFVETERRKMEERMFQQQQEFEMLRRHLEEIEAELRRSRVGSRSTEVEENSFGKRLLEIYSEDTGMVKSMDLDRSIDMDCGKKDVTVYKAESNTLQAMLGYPSISNPREIEDDPSILLQHFTNKSFLSTVFEEEEEGNDSEGDKENPPVEEVQKEVIEEKTICSGMLNHDLLHVSTVEDRSDELSSDTAPSSRKELIQNIFKLCGNSRELSLQCITTTPSVPAGKRVKDTALKSPPVKEIGEDSPIRKIHNFCTEKLNDSKENFNPTFESIGVDLEVHVKWEAASKENPGIITTLKVVKGSTLADLRKLVEIHLGADNQELNFLEMSGAPVPKEEESATPVSKLPWFNFNNQSHGYLACLHPVKGNKRSNYEPFSPLENKLPLTLNSLGIEGH
ncbi:kinesin-like protein KIN-10A [Solanum dulcamara]|uniref:kinesin-like protein KIN-10A n=1 Tax=Solanum dulcamara TaxID=45834 RepID=UPI002485D497|nr:kinesin-like protein KIN-10A [Solanum dulcamara]